jgi:hypothetical protein
MDEFFKEQLKKKFKYWFLVPLPLVNKNPHCQFNVSDFIMVLHQCWGWAGGGEEGVKKHGQEV